MEHAHAGTGGVRPRRRLRRRRGTLVGVSATLLALAGGMWSALPGAATADELVYRGCITGEKSGLGRHLCARIPTATGNGGGSGLSGPSSMTLGPGGESLYASAPGDEAMARFLRRPTGTLAWGDCITGGTEAGPLGSGACAAIPTAAPDGTGSGLNPLSAVVSPDGGSLYAISQAFCDGGGDSCHGSNAVAQFDRDPESGVLTYRGCLTGDQKSGAAGSNACTDIPSATPDGSGSGLAAPGSLAVSPDGGSLYVAPGNGSADSDIARFARDPITGELTYKGCVTGNTALGQAGSGACAVIRTATEGARRSGLYDLRSLAVSPDAKSLYAAAIGDDAVARFARDPATGRLEYRGCITGDKRLGPSGSDTCDRAPTATRAGTYSGLGGPISVATSPDGDSLYVAALRSDAIARFARKPSGALVFRDCITGLVQAGPGGSGACTEVPFAGLSESGSGLEDLSSLEVSADGRSLFVAGGDLVGRFHRRPGGAIVYRECFARGNRSPACERIPISLSAPNGLGDLRPLAASPDGRSLYVAATLSMARFGLAPQTRITAGPAGATRRHRAVLEFRASRRSTFECKVTGRRVKPRLEEWRHCGRSKCSRHGKKRYADLRRGRKVFKVRSTDRAGTTDPTPATRRWRIRSGAS